MGLVTQGKYLYASFTDSNTIATFSIEGGCSLTFISDTAVTGVNGGIINAMATNGTVMVVTYTDGSIESFNIANGVPVSNGMISKLRSRYRIRHTMPAQPLLLHVRRRKDLDNCDPIDRHYPNSHGSP